MSDLVLSADDVEALTGYANATKQLQVLHRRGYHRAFINRLGAVVLERAHYEAVATGEARAAKTTTKSANLSFLRPAA
ncbi:MAG: DUF4224 domain-containing protein [Hydrogenophaga sp.]|nr:DUF4224 domain-containing protein [Hydrogenophaga sp.]